MSFVYRIDKGSPLTHSEYDANWAYQEELFEDTEAARDIAVAGGAFMGHWSDQTGAAEPPFAVRHDDRNWGLTTTLADITASEPSDVNDDWVLLQGTAAYKDHGTGADEVPLNSDLPSYGTAATKDHGTGAGEVPLNSDLGDMAVVNSGTAIGDGIVLVDDDGGDSDPGLPAISGRKLTNLSHPIYVLFNASPAATFPPLYACRAWCHYDAIATVVRGSGNIDSVVDNGSSLFTFNFDINMPDEYYTVMASTGGNETGNLATGATLPYNYSASGFNLTTGSNSGTRANRERTCIVVFHGI